MERLSFDEDENQKLALQSFTCSSCGGIQMFQDLNRFDHTLQKTCIDN